jgi:hypothetical protein
LYKDHVVFAGRKNTASRGFLGMSFYISLHGCHCVVAQAAECALYTGLHRCAVAGNFLTNKNEDAGDLTDGCCP